MQTFESRVARYLVLLRSLSRLIKLIFPVFSELQWIIVGSVLMYQVAVNYEVVWENANSSLVTAAYSIVAGLALVWLLYVEVIRHKRLSGSIKFVISSIYYLFFAGFAAITLYNHSLPQGNWWESLNYYLAMGVLIVAVTRGVIVLIVMKLEVQALESVLGDRMSDRQYSAPVLLGVAAVTIGMLYVFMAFYDGQAAPTLLAVVYTGILVRAVEFALPQRLQV